MVVSNWVGSGELRTRGKSSPMLLRVQLAFNCWGSEHRPRAPAFQSVSAKVSRLHAPPSQECTDTNSHAANDYGKVNTVPARTRQVALTDIRHCESEMQLIFGLRHLQFRVRTFASTDIKLQYAGIIP